MSTAGVQSNAVTFPRQACPLPFGMVMTNQQAYRAGCGNKVKTRPILLLSVSLNLALAATLVTLRCRTPVATASTDGAEIVTRFVTNEVFSAPAAGGPAVPAAEAFHWRMIESENIHQYLANLRRIGCPEKLLPDLVVDALDRAYKPRLEFNQVYYEPWQGRDRRDADRRAWEERKAAAEQEERALIRQLLGYEWSGELAKLWDTEPSLFVFLGFLSEGKARQVMAVVSSEMEGAMHLIRRAQGIFLDEDYDTLRKIRNDIQMELGRMLAPFELEELEARAQLGLLFDQGFHLDGMNLNGYQLRQIMLASRSYKDVLSEVGPLKVNPSETEEPGRLMAFEKDLAAKLNPTLLAEFKRAQDDDFCKAFAFTKRQKLAKEAAVKIYEAQRAAQQQASEITSDSSLSADEKTAALQFLQETTAVSVTSVLGKAATNYFKGPGKWLNNITGTTEKKSQASTGGTR